MAKSTPYVGKQSRPAPALAHTGAPEARGCCTEKADRAHLAPAQARRGTVDPDSFRSRRACCPGSGRGGSSCGPGRSGFPARRADASFPWFGSACLHGCFRQAGCTRSSSRSGGQASGSGPSRSSPFGWRRKRP